MKEKEIIEMILNEVERAEKLHSWPIDIIHQVSIINEESGESIHAALNYIYEEGSKDRIILEVIHTAATCVRFLKNI